MARVECARSCCDEPEPARGCFFVLCSHAADVAGAGKPADAVAEAQGGERTIAVADGGDFSFYQRLPGGGLLPVRGGTEVHRPVSRAGSGADRTADVPPLRLSLCPAADQQSHYQLQQPVSEQGNDVPAEPAS